MPTNTTPSPATVADATTARLAQLGELITKARTRGVPVPDTMHVHVPLGGVTFQATEHEYAAWCDLLDNADTDTYVRDGIRWHTAIATHEGLTIEWYASTPLDAATGPRTRLFGYVPEPEPLDLMLAAVERIIAARQAAPIATVEVKVDADHLRESVDRILAERMDTPPAEDEPEYVLVQPGLDGVAWLGEVIDGEASPIGPIRDLLTARQAPTALDRDTVARALAHEDDEGVFEMLDEWLARPQSERDAHPEEAPDEEDLAYYRRHADAVLALPGVAQAPTVALAVMAEVVAERQRQDEKWGEQNHPNGTGGLDHEVRASIARAQCNEAATEGRVTYRHILTEEVAEAYAESDPNKLRDELIQVAAVAVAWVEKLDRDVGRGRLG